MLGRRGATPRPGSITEFIRERGLLSPAEVDRIIETAPTALLDLQATQAALLVEHRAKLGRWLDAFHRASDALAGDHHHA